MNSRKKIAIAAGGDSSEYSISMKSALVVQQHLQANFDTYLIEIKGANWRYMDQNQSYEIDKNDFSLFMNGESIRFDLVFIAIHGTPGEDGKLQGYLDMLKIPYTSSNLLASAVSFNKGVTNDYLKSHGICVAKSVQLFQGIPYIIEDIVAQLGLPCFVKPNQSGSSFGVQKVKKIEDLPQAIESAFEIDKQVLIESFVQGREVTCGVNNFNGTLTAMPITEIISENEFFDFSAKYEGKSQEITPADLPEESTKKVQELAKKVFQLLGLNGVARVDFIIQNNEPHLIEANTVPGLSAESIIPQQARAMGYSLTDFFTAWVNHFL
jgi:D-alanine-D-alanine ligase